MMLQSKKYITQMGVMTLCGTCLCGFGTELEAKKRTPKLVAPLAFDATKRKKTKHQINAALSYSAYASLRFQEERNLSLDTGSTDKTTEFSLYLGGVFRAKLNDRIQAFAHLEGELRQKSTQAVRYSLRKTLNVKEAHVSFKLTEQSQLTVGRMRFSDAHRWIVDASVDGVHYGFKSSDRVFELAAFKDVFKGGGQYLMAHGARYSKKGHTGVYALVEQVDQTRRIHVVGYTKQKVSARFEYAIVAGAVLGDAANGKSAGFGFDARATYKFDLPGNPQVVFGLAAGSEGFVQSDLNSNKTYNGGQTQLHRYGFVYQPDLTNLAVASVSLGLRPSRMFSLDLGAHVYVQPSASTRQPTARVRGATTGVSGYLGSELSLTGAWRPSKTTKVELGVGAFKAGSAYANRGTSKRVYARFSMYF